MASPPESLYARGFAADARTERALRAGLAGREVRVQRGRLDAALQALASEPSPKLVFVDLDGSPEPEAAASKLTAVCAFGTTVIAIGSTDTADLTRALLRHGVADYLVKPLSAAAVREASAAALENLPDRPYAGRVVALAGTAGSGVSTLVAAIVRTLAATGRTASVVDLDPASGTLAHRLGATPAGDLAAVLAAGRSGPDASPDLGESSDPDEAVGAGRAPSPEQLDGVRAPSGIDGVSLVAYPPAGPMPEPASPAAVGALLEHLANRSHLVLVTGLSDPELRTELMQRADARVLLYEPTLPNIGAAVQSLARLGPEHPVVLVQSHPRTRRSALSQAQIRYALAERRPDVVIPFEPVLHAAATGEKPGARLGKAYRDALRQVMERAVESLAPSDA
ncbi:MAG: ATP/GTP-binding protein [Chromatiales bacterium]|nr:ATP/GTP-binding protein [Chromatiales bacterium]